MKIKVGIFFGGPSREREIAFAGGRTVYDNLDKALFEPIPIFVDSARNFIQLNWLYLYKGSIRDFFPPIEHLPNAAYHFQIYQESLGDLSEAEYLAMVDKVGTPIDRVDLPQLISIAFLALHGEYGEDGQIQQELEALRIPYTGSGVEACKIGMDKAWQKRLMSERGFDTPEVLPIKRSEWTPDRIGHLFTQAVEKISYPMVIRPANQGSSIGVSIVEEVASEEAFRDAVNAAFFREEIRLSSWSESGDFEKTEYLQLLADIRDGIGFPMQVTYREQRQLVYHPEALLELLNTYAQQGEPHEQVLLEGQMSEQEVIVEEFIRGSEFSCIVVRHEEGHAVALPPTEIRKQADVFDYRSKYMPGFSRKITPIERPAEQIRAIQRDCEKLFTELGFGTYARIDGFITEEGRILLNDPNTTSGMMPSSFFFHQAAEIGLTPAQFLTYIIRMSIWERCQEYPEEATYPVLLEHLDDQIRQQREDAAEKEKVGIIMGGYSYERHISVESGRNVFEKLSSSDHYEPIPLYLIGDANYFELYQIPIPLLLKDNADDIAEKIQHFQGHPIIDEVKDRCHAITAKYASRDMVFKPRRVRFDDLPAITNLVFIALHGRPGEDGQIQQALESRGIAHNGSGVEAAALTIDKYQTLQKLKANGFPVTEQLLLDEERYDQEPELFYDRVESHLDYPLVAKPVDDGCSSAVQLIHNRQELDAYTRLIFRPQDSEGLEYRRTLRLKPKEEFPRKREILFEKRITREGADRFLEITAGLLTHREFDGQLRYEMFEPSEVVAGSHVLTLEEKFLAGEGQNITPARFADDAAQYQKIASQVKGTLERAARLLGVEGYARIDAFVRIFDADRAETIIVEVNALPGMTPATAIFHQAAINGYTPYAFINKILEYASRRRHQLEPASQGAAPTEPENTGEVSDAGLPDLDPEITPYEMEEAAFSEPHKQEPQPPAQKIERLPDTLTEDRSVIGWIKWAATGVWAFVSSPVFLKNLAALVILGLLLLGLTQGFLKWYTHHGESLMVEDYRGLSLEEARRKVRGKTFNVVINDSIYVIGERPHMVISQNPRPNNSVKKNRNIYLTITSSTAPMVPLPSLSDGSENYDLYKRKLERLDIFLKVADRRYREKIAENTILYLIVDGKRVEPSALKNGIEVPKGSTVEAVIAVRNTGTVGLPKLVCRQYDEAEFLLQNYNLEVGTIYGDYSNRYSAYVYRQDPEFTDGRDIPVGTKVDLYLTDSRPSNCN